LIITVKNQPDNVNGNISIVYL